MYGHSVCCWIGLYFRVRDVWFGRSAYVTNRRLDTVRVLSDLIGPLALIIILVSYIYMGREGSIVLVSLGLLLRLLVLVLL